MLYLISSPSPHPANTHWKDSKLQASLNKSLKEFVKRSEFVGMGHRLKIFLSTGVIVMEYDFFLIPTTWHGDVAKY